LSLGLKPVLLVLAVAATLLDPDRVRPLGNLLVRNLHARFRLTPLRASATRRGDVDVPSAKIDDDLKTLFRNTVLAIGGKEPATKVPSWPECRYCDISKADCPQRIDVRPGTTSSHGLF
jgi:hypothetical protein